MKTLIIPFLILSVLNINEKESNTSGSIVYEETVKFEIELEGDNAAFADLMPSESKAEKVLYFNSEASLYKNLEKEEPENSIIEQESQDVVVMIEIANSDDKVFHDLLKNEIIEQTEFMSRSFLIVDEVEDFSWKLTGNQKEILGYNCQEAVSENEDGEKTIAWFTPQIPVSIGPGSFSGLPGAILSVSSDDGDYEIIAKSVEFEVLDEEILEKPKKGKKVSRKEYKKIVDEKTKEMEEQYGSEGGVVIQIQSR